MRKARRRREGVVVLCSGGLDSCVLVAELARQGRTVYPFYIEAGLAWERAERASLARFLKAVPSSRLKPLVVSRLPLGDLYGSHWSLTGKGVPGAGSPDRAVYLPGRNLALLAKTFIFAANRGVETVALAFLKGNPFPDSRPEFLKASARAATLALGRPLRVETPFSRWSKAEVIRRGAGLPLSMTFSCLNPKGRIHCGRCNKCAERQRAFREAGVKDRTRYAVSS